MICAYLPDATDFSSNGLGALDPIACDVHEIMNGIYELTLVHPLDDADKWQRLSRGNIIRVPVPTAMTPAIEMRAPTSTTEVWKITGGRVNLRSGTGTKYKILKTYSRNTEVVALDKSNASWYELAMPDGKRGYMSTQYLAYVRTETVAESITSVVEPRQLRDQPFRIHDVVPGIDTITVYARHIWYDLADNMILSYAPKNVAGAAAAAGIFASCEDEHAFSVHSDLATIGSAEWLHVNPIDATLGEDGLLDIWGGELVRDWYDAYVVTQIGQNRGVTIRYGKNMTGIGGKESNDDVVTRIVPVGSDKDGKPLYLPEKYIDSPNIEQYPHPRWSKLTVSDAKETATKTKAQCYTIMRQAVQAAFDAGADMPDIQVTVDFVNQPDTVEYAGFSALQNIFLGDTVRVIHGRGGFWIGLRMTEYVYDSLSKRYTYVSFGAASDGVESTGISPKQLPNGKISGAKLAYGSVGSGQLQDGAVGSLKIETAAINIAHINSAAINDLSAQAITALRAKIDQIVSEEVTTDELYAALGEIIVLRFQQATGGSIETDELRAGFAQILRGEFGSLNVGWAQIKDLISETAIFTEGVGGRLFVTRLAVTEANMVSLTVGELMIKGTDGTFRRLGVDGEGNVTATVVQVAGDNIANETIPGGKLVENTITAREINVSELFADEAMIGAIRAGNIAAGAIEALHLSANAIAGLNGSLELTANNSIKAVVGDIKVGGENYIRNSTGDFGIASWTYYTHFTLIDDGDHKAFEIYRTGYEGTSRYGFSQALTLPSLAAEAQYTLSGWVYVASDIALSANDNECSLRVYLLDGLSYIAKSNFSMTTPTDQWIYFSAVGVVPADAVSADVLLLLSNNGRIRFRQLKLESGNKATAWTSHPEEFRAGSSIMISREEVRITAPKTLIAIPVDGGGGEIAAQIDENGAFFPTLESPTVSALYAGPLNITVNPTSTPSGTVFTSLSAAIATINDRQINDDITITIVAGAVLNENVIVRGISGHGMFTITSSDTDVKATINGRVLLYGNSITWRIIGMIINAQFTSGTSNFALASSRNLFGVVRYCIVNGNAYTHTGICAQQGGSLLIETTEVYNGVNGVTSWEGTMVNSLNIKGSGFTTRALYSYGGNIKSSGTIPVGALTAAINGSLVTTGCTTNAGSGTTPPELVTSTYDATLTGWKQVSWSSETYVRQGLTQYGAITGCMWFNNTTIRAALAGKTIESATLRIKRRSGTGKSTAVQLRLHGISLTGKSGTPTLVTSYGLIGSLAWSETGTLAIPAAAITDLRAGTINGFALHTGETTYSESKGYSDNYAAFDGTEAVKPQLGVTYQ